MLQQCWESSDLKYFINIGSSPSLSMKSEGGCNGGGLGQSTIQNLYGGGGATDIRLVENTIYHRIVVAGGAGGCNDYNAYGGNPPGAPTKDSCTGKICEGEFGYGGNSTLDYNGGAGGGGGWYGGFAFASSASNYWACGEGGTIFILSEYAVTPSEYYFKSMDYFSISDPFIANGNSQFPSIESLINETGHIGDGAFRLTTLMLFKYKINSCQKNTFSYPSFFNFVMIFSS